MHDGQHRGPPRVSRSVTQKYLGLNLFYRQNVVK
jgi:hypothetical protein